MPLIAVDFRKESRTRPLQNAMLRWVVLAGLPIGSRLEDDRPLRRDDKSLRRFAGALCASPGLLAALVDRTVSRRPSREAGLALCSLAPMATRADVLRLIRGGALEQLVPLASVWVTANDHGALSTPEAALIEQRRRPSQSRFDIAVSSEASPSPSDPHACRPSSARPPSPR